MVAIAALLAQTDATFLRRAVDQMLARQALVGGSARISEAKNAAIGVRRSVLLPEDRFDEQPQVNPNLRILIAADVRLDNRDDLCRALGLDSRTLADSAILAEAFRHWSYDCVTHLVGDFAFSIYDQQTGAMFFACDPTGRRPLALWRRNGLFALASLPHAFSGLTGAERGFDEEAFAKRLAAIRDEHSICFWPNVQMLHSGHAGLFKDGDLSIWKWWDPRDAPALRFKRNDDYVGAAREVLTTAVTANLRSAGGVAAHLSAGLDSTAVATAAADVLRDRGERLLALTAAPASETSAAVRIDDESRLAAQTASMSGNIDHIIVRTVAEDLFGLLDTFSNATGMSNNSARDLMWWQAMHAEAAARGKSTILTGALGNATLSYDGWTLNAQDIKDRRLIRAVARVALSIVRGRVGPRGFFKTFLGPLCLNRFPAFQKTALWRRMARGLDQSRQIDCYAGLSLSDRYALPTRMKHRWDRIASGAALTFDHDRLHAITRWPTGLAIKSELAFHGIDLRDPLADRRLIEFCFSIPPEQFILNGMPRSLARRLLKGVTPKEILTVRRRAPQGTDFAELITKMLPDLRSEIDAIDDWQGARDLIDTNALRSALEVWEKLPIQERSAHQSRLNSFVLRTLSSARLARSMEGANR